MTIYSQHPNRGKVQILATYQGPSGVLSTTVTSVENQAVAGPIVDALNRVSAYTTVPVSVQDERDDRYRRYPTDHIEALVDPEARLALRVGAHSLWYQHIMLRLGYALKDLDEATASAPPPVRVAVAAELEVEARDLRHGLAEFSEGVRPPDDATRRIWDNDAPFVTSEEALSDATRRRLDEQESEGDAADRRRAVADLQLLYDAYVKTTSTGARLELGEFLVEDDPWGDERDNFFLDMSAPLPDEDSPQDAWSIGIYRWVPDDPGEEYGAASGDSILECRRSTAPDLDELVNLLNLSNGDDAQLAAWAATPVGEPLGGTTFVVTARYTG
ncbi:hypothetical protein [Kribbella solani]|uniref:Uncharacterized protein n=1 Tax=Kribbella solani TaxID=236067 RepID=A0A841DTK5_9ACTN|nr:hypothetical protein [Kribbella solani]MBB5982454.1 hypothetical protein [Kribbella solani]